AVQRQLEDRHRCEFQVDALPAVLDLQRRYVRDVAMPGKAADLLRRLAASNEKRPVGRAEALAAFQSYTGLSTLFVDQTVRLARKDVVADLSRRVVAQPEAVAAMADAVCVAKARLNDPARPVATFLFLGPTGVGKTECAKALARYLFGGAAAAAASGAAGEDATDRLLRFDMNEYLDPGSAGRLIGTPRDPDGLLTAAVRRQPFSVVLLDEVEKAHPAVFDLLLGVLGEGRLTDARGRTADFTNCIVVMTSNLGVREAEASFGLGDPARPGSKVVDQRVAHDRYLDAAKRFFRPEFFNRIDRVVPFARLGRDDVAAIARRLLDGLLARQGLTGRRCVMRVDPAALGRIVDAGYHPRLGARALKREVERRIAMPVARRLATLPPGEPTVIDVVPGDAGARDAAAQVAVRVTPLEPAPPAPPTRAVLLDPAWADPAERLGLVDDLLDRAEAALARLEARAEALAPERGMQQGRMSASHFAYLAIREQAKTVGNLIGWIDRVADQAAKPPERNVRAGARRGPQARPRPAVRRGIGAAAAWQHLVDADPV
ncbi:MAG TPA: AAA family ATPase, partial [Humisphaera sp.]